MVVGNLRQAVLRATDRYGGGGGCLLPGDVCMKTIPPVADVLREKHPGMCVPPMKNPICMAFEEYEEVLETTTLEVLEEDVTRVPSKLSGSAGALGAEAIGLRNCLLCFRCAPEEFRFVVVDLHDWIDTPPPPLHPP